MQLVAEGNSGPAIAEQRWPDAAASLNRIRVLILVNLVLGLAISAHLSTLRRQGR